MEGAPAFRIPADRAYTDALGRAAYNFVYYEWAVIWTVEVLEPGYVQRCTSRPITSGQVAADFAQAVRRCPTLGPAMRASLAAQADRFGQLKDERNKLLHAHPYTDQEGAQRLLYQGRLPGAAWELGTVEAAARAFDDAACELSPLFEQLRRAAGT